MRKNKKLFFLLLVVTVAMSVAPLRVSATEACEDNNATSRNSDGNTLKENSQAAADQAAKDSNAQASAEAGSGATEFDDGSGENNFTAPSQASTLEPSNQKANLDAVDLNEHHLAQQIEAAQQAVANIKRDRAWLQNRSISLEARNMMKSGTEQDRHHWTDVSRRYHKFLEERATEADRANTTQEQQILTLITASNKASKAAQGFLKFLSPGETSRMPGPVMGEQSEIDAKNTALHPNSVQQEDPKKFLFPAPVLSELDLRSPKTTKIFLNFVQRRKDQEAPYQAADALFLQSKKHWDEWAMTGQKCKETEDALQYASDQFKKEETRLKELDLQKTLLGRIQQAADIAGGLAGFADNFPCVSVSGICNTISTGVGLINEGWHKASYWAAERAVNVARQKNEEAGEAYKQALANANKTDVEITKQRKVAVAAQRARTKILAEALKPPALHAAQNEWRAWADEIAPVAIKPIWEPLFLELIAKRGLKHPSLVAREVGNSWRERKRFSNEELEKYLKEKNTELQPLEADYITAQTEAKRARATADETQNAFDQLTLKIQDAEEEYNSFEKTLNDLGKKSETPEIKVAIAVVKIALMEAQMRLTKAQEKEATTQAFQKDLDDKSVIAKQAEEHALDSFKKYDERKRFHERKIQRAQDRAAADEEAWRAVWPEEALNEKLLNRSGENAFNNARILKTETAWLAAQKEAEELAALWRRMHENNLEAATVAGTTPEQDKMSFEHHAAKALEQKTSWEEQTTMAQGKAAFTRIKNLWSPFQEASETFVNNSTHEQEKEHAALIKKTATDIVTASIQEQKKEKTSQLKEIFHQLPAPLKEELKTFHEAVGATSEAAQRMTDLEKNIHRRPWLNTARKIEEMLSIAAENVSPTWNNESTWLRKVLQQSAQFIRKIDPHVEQADLMKQQTAIDIAKRELEKLQQSASAANEAEKAALRKEIQTREQTLSEGREQFEQQQKLAQEREAALAQAQAAKEAELEKLKNELMLEKSSLTQTGEAQAKQAALLDAQEKRIEALQQELERANMRKEEETSWAAREIALEQRNLEIKKLNAKTAFAEAQNLAATKLHEATELEKSAEPAFLNMKDPRNEADWISARDQAMAVELAWNEVIEAHQKILSEHESVISEEEKARLTLEMKNAQTQKIAWEQKSNVAYAKATFAKAKVVWTDFSEAAQAFIESPTQAKLELATAAAYAAVDATYAAADTDATYAATYAARAAAYAADAATIYPAHAAAYATRAAAYHARTAGAMWKDETQWAVSVAREAADFCKAVEEFYEKQEAARANTKALFKRAKSVWKKISRAAQKVKSDPDSNELYTICSAADTLAKVFANDITSDVRSVAHAVTASAASAAYIAAARNTDDHIKRAATMVHADGCNPVIHAQDATAFRATRAAAYAVANDTYAADDDSNPTDIDAHTAANAYAAANAARALQAVGTIWEEEAQWAAIVTQEAADFCEAVQRFRKKKSAQPRPATSSSSSSATPPKTAASSSATIVY